MRGPPAVCKGLKRYYETGELHYITCNCYQREPWLDADRQRDLFLEILEEVRQQHRFMVLGYAVMREHFHLLMSPHPSLAKNASSGAPEI
jgi:REP element-mobilizing transposase RayT